MPAEEQIPVDPLAGEATDELASARPQAREDESLRQRVRNLFWPMFGDMGGIDSWLVSPQTPDSVFERLSHADSDPLTHAQLCQLLILSHEAGMSQGFYEYYWLSEPLHIYPVTRIGDHFDKVWIGKEAVSSLPHLRWGLYRFYVDALLCFGNVRSAYRALRGMSLSDLQRFFGSRRLDTAELTSRGPALLMHDISKDNRYLIAEMACKSLEGGAEADLSRALREAYADHVRATGSPVALVSDLVGGSYVAEKYEAQQQQFEFSADELLDVTVRSESDLNQRLERHHANFDRARTAALQNTKLYLSMVEEMDVYVATSMRTRQDFREMAAFCEEVFSDPELQDLEVRFFDPTTSAAQGHIDKGLIECLMVKAAKALVYYAGKSETLGKDAEFTMALTQGKPAIIYCEKPERERLYKEIHPLTRLIDFNSGVATGAMVTASRDVVKELLNRVLRNSMEYDLTQTSNGSLLLKERLTQSTVRLQTSDLLLQETFWNYYQSGERNS